MYRLIVLYTFMYMKGDCTVLTDCILYLYVHKGRLYCTDWLYCIPLFTWREIVLYRLIVLYTCMYMKGDCTRLTDCIVYLYVHEGRFYCTDWLYCIPVCTWREIVLDWPAGEMQWYFPELKNNLRRELKTKKNKY